MPAYLHRTTFVARLDPGHRISLGRPEVTYIDDTGLANVAVTVAVNDPEFQHIASIEAPERVDPNEARIRQVFTEVVHDTYADVYGYVPANPKILDELVNEMIGAYEMGQRDALEGANS